MISTTLQEQMKTYEKEVIQIRRKLHEKPELAFEEVETTAFVCQYLDELGIPYEQAKPTGVIATIEGGLPGKTIALRADMDALPLQQLNQHVPYASKIDGKMHGCGHDAHTAMLLVAAKALVGIKDHLKGNVRLLFQPAEEIAQGAKTLVEQGCMENVDEVFGIHIWSQMPTNTVSCPAGPAFAAADIFKVHFVGKGGHGAIPENCIDTAMIASSFVMNVQTVVSRLIDPQQPAVLTIGKMDVGTKFNIIAENALIEGTVRTFDQDTRDKIEREIEQYAHAVAQMYGGKASVEYIRGTEPVINADSTAKRVQQITADVFGEEAVYFEKPTMGAEDFSFYLEQAPGGFALVGSGNAAKGTDWAHHHGNFDIDEDALITGASLYAQYAWAYLTDQDE